MADMISRDLAITVCENHLIMKEADPTDNPLINAYKAGFRDAIRDMMLDLREIKARQDWIPVEKGLPQKNGQYIITDVDGEIMVVEFTHGEWIYYGAVPSFTVEVVAWQAMPKAYRKKEAKKKYDRLSHKR